ncbi:MAG TPA: hypothetical protein VG965_00300 [Patescibacteria group bacterium]|nr:hypothetical protein [Patescibacteria group bacterium]
MTFDEKVEFIRSLPQFRVIPINEVRAIAFAVKEVTEPADNTHVLKKIDSGAFLTLTQDDINKITREYPELAAKLT